MISKIHNMIGKTQNVISKTQSATNTAIGPPTVWTRSLETVKEWKHWTDTIRNIFQSLGRLLQAASQKIYTYYHRFIDYNILRIGLLSRNKWFGQMLVTTAHKLILYRSQSTFLTLILVRQKLHSDISQNPTASLACKSVSSQYCLEFVLLQWSTDNAVR